MFRKASLTPHSFPKLKKSYTKEKLSLKKSVKTLGKKLAS